MISSPVQKERDSGGKRMEETASMYANQEDEREEGWLYLVRINRFGLHSSTKRFFVLQRCETVQVDFKDDFYVHHGHNPLHIYGDYDDNRHHCNGSSSRNVYQHVLKCYKCPPSSDSEIPLRSAVIDSSIRVTDNGRETIHRKLLFMFTLYNTCNHDDRLKLGASSPEEAAKWIRAFQRTVLKGGHNLIDCSKSNFNSLRLSGYHRSSRMRSIDWTLCPSTRTDAVTDVIAPSTWTIFGCQNGLRLFKEAKDRDSRGKWDDQAAIMAVGVVDGPSEDIFQALMSLGPSRSEWDFCFHKGSVIEHLDGHTDIIHKQLYKDWLPWEMKHRDLLLRRYWRREDDGTYVILYHSVFHKRCPPQKGFIRASLKSGGFVVTPIDKGKRSLVKHMLSIDWKSWKLYMNSSSSRSITIRMLGRVAALREFFRAKLWEKRSPEFSSGELDHARILEPQSDQSTEWEREICEVADKDPSERSSLVGLNDAADEFFDVPEPSDDIHPENGWSYDHETSQDVRTPRLSSAAVFVKKLHDLAVQKKGYVDLQETVEKRDACSYGNTLPKDSSCVLPSTWAMADPSSFLIRGKNYLDDQKKIKAKGSLMELVGSDWLKSDKREDDLAGRNGSIVQKSAAEGGSEFFFVVNIQVPGAMTYNLAFYFMLTSPLHESPLLESFVNGDDAYRNARFKLIPYISKGSWIVKQSVGKKACLVGQSLEINYFRGPNYIELGVDIGSSTVARGVVSLVLGYLTNLVIEMAFVIQANTEEELPEHLLGTCRVNHLDATKALSLIA